MGFLNLPQGLPDFTKCVISIWFRVPQASLQKGIKDYKPPPPYVPWTLQWTPIPNKPLNGVVPLLTFGRPQTMKTWTTPPTVVGSYSYTQWFWQSQGDGGGWVVAKGYPYTYDVTASALTPGPEYPMDPCFIGVECTPAGALDDGSGGNPVSPPEDTYVLKIVLQMDDYATTNTLGYMSDASASDENDYQYPSGISPSAPSWQFVPFTPTNFPYLIDGVNEGVFEDRTFPKYDKSPISFSTTSSTFTSLSGPPYASPERFELGGINTALDGGGTSDDLTITPDHWHHLLFSMDLSKGVATHGAGLFDSGQAESVHGLSTHVDRAVQCWIALDKKNITKSKLSQYWPQGFNKDDSTSIAGPNDVITPLAFFVSANSQAAATVSTYVDIYSRWNTDSQQGGTDIPNFSYTPKKGAPSAGAELAIPSTPTYADNIYQVEMGEFYLWTGQSLDTGDQDNIALFVDDQGKPAKPEVAKNALGEPTIALHGSSNWIQGKNTGTTGVDADGKTISQGQLDPTGKIKSYKPDPSLHGPQSPPQGQARARQMQLTRA